MDKRMKNILYFSFLFALAGALMGCGPRQGETPSAGTGSDEPLAREALVTFLERLHDGQYDQAALLYGGTYETMIAYNPDTAPGDYAGLLRNACTVNGIQCLRVKSAQLDRQVSEKEFVFEVEFLNADGTLFVLGPCCGADETDSPPQSVFYLTVVKVEPDRFAVMDMPPYVP
jgi:hypothetical protein